ncbi:MAG: chemotaxis protein CheW, partial [Herminiimonas sp.]|nr:chemotaxis protein CheW [Herminiimonas sp.]
MQAARGGVDARAGQLGVLIGATRWLIDLQQAGEIVAVGTITGVPLTQPWFLGLTNIRGSLIAVVDYAYFQGEALTVIDKQSRIIAFAPGLSFNGGLLVSRVLGLRNIADMQPHDDGAAPVVNTDVVAGTKAATGERRRRIQHYIDRDSVVWQTLDLYAVKRDP